MPKSRFYFDLIERSVWTFLQAGAAIMIVEQDWNISALKVALVAGGIAVMKAIIATRVGGDENSAATLTEGMQK